MQDCNVLRGAEAEDFGVVPHERNSFALRISNTSNFNFFESRTMSRVYALRAEITLLNTHDEGVEQATIERPKVSPRISHVDAIKRAESVPQPRTRCLPNNHASRRERHLRVVERVR